MIKVDWWAAKISRLQVCPPISTPFKIEHNVHPPTLDLYVCTLEYTNVHHHRRSCGTGGWGGGGFNGARNTGLIWSPRTTGSGAAYETNSRTFSVSCLCKRWRSAWRHHGPRSVAVRVLRTCVPCNFPLFIGRCEYDALFVAFPSRVRPLTIRLPSSQRSNLPHSHSHTPIPTLLYILLLSYTYTILPAFSLYPLRCLPRKSRPMLLKQPTPCPVVVDGQWASVVFLLFIAQFSLLQASEESRTCQGAAGPGGQARWPWRSWRSWRRSCRSYGYQARVQKVSDACLPYICVR